MVHKRKLLQLVILALVALVAVSCVGRVRVGDLQTDTETVELGGAESARVELRMGAGRLNLSGGASELMNAEFSYNVADWQPEVSYETQGNEGVLTVSQPGMEGDFGIPDDQFQNQWDISLADDVPLAMDVQLGAGDSSMELASLNLQTLRVETGAGDVEMNLGGTLTDLDVGMGAGQVELNLSEEWQQDLEAVIRGGVGRLSLILPSSAGVRVEVEQGIGNVNASNLQQDGNTYVNDTYGEAETTLNIRVEGGVGEIVLDVAE
jgi:hypothetical protein